MQVGVAFLVLAYNAIEKNKNKIKNKHQNNRLLCPPWTNIVLFKDSDPLTASHVLSVSRMCRSPLWSPLIKNYNRSK